MQRITELKDIGIGKKCLLIGGGMSVLNFDFSRLPDDFVKIVVNDAFPNGIRVDYMIYNDLSFLKMLKNLKIPEGVKIIGYVNNPSKKMHYGYRLSDLKCVSDFSNTGLKALLIAKNIMRFDEIYLIGFDFHTRKVSGKQQSHFFGDDIGHNRKYPEKRMLNDHFERLKGMVCEFEVIKERENVYNCYKDSKLKIFSYLLPY